MLPEIREDICLVEDDPPSDVNLKNIFLKFLIFTAAMFTLPFLGYYYVKDAALRNGIGSPQNFIYGTVTAVVIVNAIIAGYVFQAYLEEKEEKRAKAKEKTA